MSYTENVANFMGSINELDGINVDDLEAVAPDAIKKVRSQPNSPFASRDTSPIRHPSSIINNNNNHNINNNLIQAATILTNGSTTATTNGYGTHMNGNGLNHDYSTQNGFNGDHSDDEYIDTVDVSYFFFK